MIATVLNVQQDVTKVSARTGKPYTVTEFTYQSDPVPGYPPKKPTTRNLFTNDPLHTIVTSLRNGDRVEMTFNQDAHKSMSTVNKIDGQQQAPQQQSYSPPASKGYDNSEKDAAITRAVALKAAVETVAAMMQSGYGKLKKTMETPLYVDEIVAMSKLFEPYLLGKEESVEATQTNDEQQDFEEQNPFD